MIERSIYCGAGGLPQSSEQIIIAPAEPQDGLEVEAGGDIVARWSFRRMDNA